MKATKIIPKPDIRIMYGAYVTQDTKDTFEAEGVKQELKDLKLITHREIHDETQDYVCDFTLYLKEGDYLLFDEEIGYYKAPFPVSTIDQAYEDLRALKEFEEE